MDEAFDAFYRATWRQEWKAPAYFCLAQIAMSRADFAGALKLVNHSLDANALNVRAWELKVAVLRHLGRAGEAREALAFARRRTNPLDPLLLAEQWLLSRDPASARELFSTLNAFPPTAQEVAAAYADAGLSRAATNVLRQAIAAAPDTSKVSPLVYYYLGDFAEKLWDQTDAKTYRRIAAQLPPDYVFPFQTEMVGVLRRAMRANPADARAPYYLGNLLFDWQPEAAVVAWEKSVALDPNFSIAWRNLAEAYAHKTDDASRARAIGYLEKAVALPDALPTQFDELDQLYEATGVPVEKRLAFLEKHRDILVQKDDGLARLIGLKIFTGEADEAIALLQGRTFNVWEGGTAYNTGDLWADAHLVRGLQRFDRKDYRAAETDFAAALRFPPNLRAGERPGGALRQAEIRYWIGCAREAQGETGSARQAWNEAAAPLPAPTYRRRPGNALANSAVRYFQAQALLRLGERDRAETMCHELARAGIQALESPGNTSGRPSPRVRAATAHYIAGLGQAGLGEKEKARAQFASALAAVPDHLGAKLALERLNGP